MSLPATDAFTDVNGTQLSAHGTSWTKNTTDDPDIQSNGLCSDSANNQVCHWNADAFSNDQYAQVKLVAVGTVQDQVVGPAVRVAASAVTGYTYWHSYNYTSMWKVVDASWTQLGSGDYDDATVNDVYRLEASGTTITPKKNGTTITPGAQTDSSIASGSAGLHGYIDGTAFRVDDWQGGNLAISLNPAAATATPIPLADVRSLVRLTLDTAAATAQPINLTIGAPPPGVAVILDSVTLTAAANSLAVTGAKRIYLDPAAATATGVALTVIAPFNQTVTLDSASLTATVNDITVDAANYSVQDVGLFFPPFIDLDTATLTGTGIGIRVGTTVELDTATATATGIGISKVGQTVNLDTATLTATPIKGEFAQQLFVTLKTAVATATPIRITPAVAVTLDSTSLTATPIPFAVSAPVTIALDTAVAAVAVYNIPHVVQTNIQLDTAVLTATPIKSHIAGEQYVVLDAAQLTITTPAIDATASIVLSAAALTGTGISLDVVPGAIAIALDPGEATVTGIPIVFVTGIIVYLETG